MIKKDIARSLTLNKSLYESHPSYISSTVIHKTHYLCFPKISVMPNNMTPFPHAPKSRMALRLLKQITPLVGEIFRNNDSPTWNSSSPHLMSTHFFYLSWVVFKCWQTKLILSSIWVIIYGPSNFLSPILSQYTNGLSFLPYRVSKGIILIVAW